MMPTTRRIQPIVWISIPLTSVLTAKARIAPAAIRMSELRFPCG